MTMKRIEATVTGRVQMVMYRDFACRTARELGIVGTVQNDPDGTVFIVAEGEEAQLNAFIEKLNEGPMLARVEAVRVQWHDLKSNDERHFTTFAIVYE